MAHKKKIILLVVIALLFTLTGCRENPNRDNPDTQERVYEYGFSSKDHASLASTELFAYKIEFESFDPDNVEIIIYFGWLESAITHECMRDDIDTDFVISCSNLASGLKIELLRVDDYNEDEYRVTASGEWIMIMGANTLIHDYTFNHSEKIHIPKELFVGENGYLCFSGLGLIDNKYGRTLSGVVNYEIVDNKVSLFAPR